MSDYNVPEAGSHFPWKQSLCYLRVTLGPWASCQGNGHNSFHQKSSVIACVPRLEGHNQVEETALNNNRIKLDKQTPFVPPWLWIFYTNWVALRSHGFSTARRNHRVLTFFCRFFTWLKMNHSGEETWFDLSCCPILPLQSSLSSRVSLQRFRSAQRGLDV